MIRYKGKSYVIDVNGWSFVKGNLRYFDKCARLLRKMCLGSKIGKSIMQGFTPIYRTPIASSSNDLNASTFRSGYNHDVLKSMVVVFRHADRSPKKEKLK